MYDTERLVNIHQLFFIHFIFNLVGKHHGFLRRSPLGQQGHETDEVWIFSTSRHSYLMLTFPRFAVDKTTRILKDKLPQVAKTTQVDAQPAYARIPRQPVNRIAAIRQSQGRFYSTKPSIDHSSRHFSSTRASTKPTRASYPPSRTASAVGRQTSRVPFASTLRPSLTGGTLCRSAGGYGLGTGRVGGVRYFSHTPAAPAEVIQNVSQAVRAFWLSGQKARFDGSNPRTGEKRFRAISGLQETARTAMDMSPVHASGSYIDFEVTPTITAIGPFSHIPRSTVSSCDTSEDATITNESLISTLSVDFARSLKTLAAVMNDLKHLSALGDLPITLHNPTTLRVCFPGCDRDTVENLCRELGIQRGVVGQDEDFDSKIGTDVALLFPFAPSKTPSETMYVEDFYRPAKRSKRDIEVVDWHEMLSPSRHSLQSHASELADEAAEVVENPWLEDGRSSGYSSLHASEMHDVDLGVRYEGLEGIYRFIEECDRARR